MIGRLRGAVAEVGEEEALIDVMGVGYVVRCGHRTLSRLPALGDETLLHIESQWSESAGLRLYGFGTREDRKAFVLLQAIQGVGPKAAMAVLDVLSPAELASAVAREDKAAVGRASGVGPKLAMRLVTELKGKLPDLGGIDAGVLGLQAALGEGSAGGNVADAVSALSNLGYSSAQASAAVARVIGKEGDGVATERLIRLGLRELSS